MICNPLRILSDICVTTKKLIRQFKITFQQNQLLIELLKFGILATRKLNDYTRFGNQRLLSTTKIDLNQIL